MLSLHFAAQKVSFTGLAFSKTVHKSWLWFSPGGTGEIQDEVRKHHIYRETIVASQAAVNILETCLQ